jgi:hypothetical protein
MSGSLSVASTAVSSAKVAVIDSGEVSMSAVYSRSNNGPRTLPWVTPLRLRRVLCTQFQLLQGSVFCAKRILVDGNNSEAERVLTCIGSLSIAREMYENAAEQ